MQSLIPLIIFFITKVRDIDTYINYVTKNTILDIYNKLLSCIKNTIYESEVLYFV